MGIPRHPYEGCTYCFIHKEAHTNVRFLSCDGHQLYELGVDLEVEGVCYMITYTSPETPTCEVPSNGVVEISLLPVRTGDSSI